MLRADSLQHTYVFFAGASQVAKNPPANAGDMRRGFDRWGGKIPWGRTWQPTPVFLPGESHDRGVWWATVHRVTKNRTQWKRPSMPAFLLWICHFQFQAQSARGLERIIPPAPRTLHMKCDLLGPLTSQEGGGWTVQLLPPPVLLLIDTINIT